MLGASAAGLDAQKLQSMALASQNVTPSCVDRNHVCRYRRTYSPTGLQSLRTSSSLQALLHRQSPITRTHTSTNDSESMYYSCRTLRRLQLNMASRGCHIQWPEAVTPRIELQVRAQAFANAMPENLGQVSAANPNVHMPGEGSQNPSSSSAYSAQLAAILRANPGLQNSIGLSNLQLS